MPATDLAIMIKPPEYLCVVFDLTWFKTVCYSHLTSFAPGRRDLVAKTRPPPRFACGRAVRAMMSAESVLPRAGRHYPAREFRLSPERVTLSPSIACREMASRPPVRRP